MSAYDFAGLTSGAVGASLVLLGILLSLFTSLRLLFVIRRPGKGRIARAFAASGLALVLCGLVIFLAAEYSSFRRTVDRTALPLTAISLLLAVVAGTRAGRRRPAAVPPPRKTEESPRPDGEAAPERPVARGG
jgi:hypothetical protein